MENIRDMSKCAISLFFKWANDDWNAVELVTTGIFVFWTFALSFLVCELGQWIANGFALFNDELCSCNWYLLPSETQRLYLMFLLDAQQAIQIHCYGGIVCSRDTFKKVVLARK